MSAKTGIEWTNATWNPVTGCTKVSQGCKNCYAKRDWARLAAMPNNVYSGREFEQVACHTERLDQPSHWRKPRRVFVNSMSDLFHEDVPDEFIDCVFEVMIEASHHVFQVLTKRPARMRDYMAKRVWPRAVTINKLPPRNVWLGVSVEDQATADERIPLLLKTPAAVRWISAEPLLGSVNLERMGGDTFGHGAFHALEGMRWNFLGPDGDGRAMWDLGAPTGPRLDWVVVGGESGPNARPMHPDWARSLRDQCVAAGVPYFFKQWGNWLPKGQEGNPVHSPWKSKTSGHPILTTKRAAGRILDGRTWDEYPL